MDQANYVGYRSASLPLAPSIEPLRLAGFTETVSAKRDSTFMVTDGPITPPLSPGRSEEGRDLPPDANGAPGQTIMDQMNNGQHIKSGVLQVMRPVPGSRRASREALQSEERMDVDARRLSTPGNVAPPVRHLEDEQSHVQKGGSLRLTDFEVKGTLGEF